ncbi:hypothetical protein BDN72DRAFT_831985 [Pluteus cervinus]|uniref:Uncharacterized protein n=1 Tax=Pluteus cervinus TaxID=181527 RepID=A0ACD3BDG8_9AGAR|nr:hypothetical protein BDN72DRAFT_831985 [Pluteus cervinus]
MFNLIRRISYSVIPRSDRPWADDRECRLLLTLVGGDEMYSGVMSATVLTSGAAVLVYVRA